jgi:hypothetical protein
LPFDLDPILKDRIPADPDSSQCQRHLSTRQDELDVITAYAGPDESGNLQLGFVLYDTTNTWGPPGTDAMVTVHIRFGLPSEGLYTLHAATAPTHSLAEAWLARALAADPSQLQRLNGLPEPTDAVTHAIEKRVQRSGTRCQPLLHHYSADGASGWVILHDHHPDAAHSFLVQAESFTTGGYAIRELPFQDVNAAIAWVEQWDGRLPDLPTAAPARPGLPTSPSASSALGRPR